MTGAAFLMATSAIGPGFLTQTAVFTGQLAASFGFVILISVILDVFAQLNIWRVLTVSGKRGQDAANETVPGSGYLLALLVVFGGLVFNIANIAGCGLGLNALFDLKIEYGAAISALIAVSIFVFKEAGRTMDFFVKILGFVMLGLIVYVVFASHPPLVEAVRGTFLPDKIDPNAVITLVGGTVGGYISFAGAHRLIDAGITGIDSQNQVNRGALTGIFVTAAVRFMLFLAAFGIVAAGFQIGSENPAGSVFQSAAGQIGFRLFGVVLWSAAVTSVIGAAYTSVSFLKTFSPKIESKERYVIIGFIILSTLIFLCVGKPAVILVWAGTINGFIMPVGLVLILLASRKKAVVGEYRHPLWLQIAGWLVVLTMLAFGILTLTNYF